MFPDEIKHQRSTRYRLKEITFHLFEQSDPIDTTLAIFSFRVDTVLPTFLNWISIYLMVDHIFFFQLNFVSPNRFSGWLDCVDLLGGDASSIHWKTNRGRGYYQAHWNKWRGSLHGYLICFHPAHLADPVWPTISLVSFDSTISAVQCVCVGRKIFTDV